MNEEKEPENVVTVTLRFDEEKHENMQIFLMSLDALGEEFGFKLV